MRYLLAHGYRVIPVRPGRAEVLGVPCVASLHEIDEPIDMVDVFRRPEACPEHAREAVAVGATLALAPARDRLAGGARDRRGRRPRPTSRTPAPRSSTPTASAAEEHEGRAAARPPDLRLTSSGCRDLNSGPLRPERSALPGCATPRGDERLAEELEHSPGADLGPLDDQEVPAVGDHAERRVQAPRVLEPVLERHLAVAGAPEHEHRARTRSRSTGAGRRRRAPGRRRATSVCIVGPRSRPCTARSVSRSGSRPRTPPKTSRRRRRRARDRVRRAGRRCRPGCTIPASAIMSSETPRRARDAGCRREHEPPDELGPALGEPERDDAAERVAEDVDRAPARQAATASA